MTPGTHHPYRPQTKPFNSNHQLKIKNHLALYFFRPSGPQPFQPDPQTKSSTLEQTRPGTRLPGSGTPIKKKEKQKIKQQKNKNNIEKPPTPYNELFGVSGVSDSRFLSTLQVFLPSKHKTPVTYAYSGPPKAISSQTGF